MGSHWAGTVHLVDMRMHACMMSGSGGQIIYDDHAHRRRVIVAIGRSPLLNGMHGKTIFDL